MTHRRTDHDGEFDLPVDVRRHVDRREDEIVGGADQRVGELGEIRRRRRPVAAHLLNVIEIVHAHAHHLVGRVTTGARRAVSRDRLAGLGDFAIGPQDVPHIGGVEDDDVVAVDATRTGRGCRCGRCRVDSCRPFCQALTEAIDLLGVEVGEADAQHVLVPSVNAVPGMARTSWSTTSLRRASSVASVPG